MYIVLTMVPSAHLVFGVLVRQGVMERTEGMTARTNKLEEIPKQKRECIIDTQSAHWQIVCSECQN